MPARIHPLVITAAHASPGVLGVVLAMITQVVIKDWARAVVFVLVVGGCVYMNIARIPIEPFVQSIASLFVGFFLRDTINGSSIARAAQEQPPVIAQPIERGK